MVLHVFPFILRLPQVTVALLASADQVTKEFTVNMQPVRSCLDYNIPENKPNIYHALDSDDEVFPIFCDFRTYRSKFKVFNLIQSYKWDQKELFNDSLMKKKQIAIDDPTTTPYRLSSLRMENIRKHFSQWRVEFGKTANRDCWKRVDVNFGQKNCTSCNVRTIRTILNETTETTGQCIFTHNKSKYCEVSINNYGLYCCIEIDNINNPGENCQPDKNSKVKIWLLGKLIN